MKGMFVSLDIAVLAKDGTPDRTVSLDMKQHHYLMKSASREGLETVLLLSDYYNDVEFTVEQLPSLINDIKILTDLKKPSQSLGVLSELKALAEFALRNRIGLSAIAD